MHQYWLTPSPPLSLLLYAQWYPFMQKNGIWMCSRGVYGDGDKANIYWKWSFERIVHAAFTNFVYWILIRRRIGDCDYWIVTRCSESEIWMKPFDMNERPTIVYSGFMHTHKEKNVDIYIYFIQWIPQSTCHCESISGDIGCIATMKI